MFRITPNNEQYDYILIIEGEIRKYIFPERVYFLCDNNYNSDVNYPYGLSKNYIFDFVEDTFINKKLFRGEDGYGIGGEPLEFDLI